MQEAKKLAIFLVSLTFFTSPLFAQPQNINLTIDYKTVHFAGTTKTAIAINNQIPAPTLHFKQGDRVTINVCNKLKQETALHWHGIILPWQMDGVMGLTQHGIPPGGVFHYQFTLHQAGTYWYHAHAGLQEQQGLYGALVIDPLEPPHYQYTKDFAIVLSDWSNTHPDQILANLKKEGDYYSPAFPLQPSLAKFIHDYRNASAHERDMLREDYKMMQQMRMSIYDVSDVAYDAFLLNGHPNSHPWTAAVKVGDLVRLRFIGAGGSTIFHVKIPGASMQMIHVQGNDVQPYTINDFTIAPGETYDVLVKIEKKSPYIIYAESADKVGAAYGVLTTAPHQIVNDKHVARFAEPLPVTRDMMSMMMGGMHHHSSMSMEMPTEPTIIGDKFTSASHNNTHITSSRTKYQYLTAVKKTNDPNIPIKAVINMELFGYMDRYIWFVNGVPEHHAKPIIFEPGNRYRIHFTNTSMMHHPMHIHGHWFILREGKGAYDPLLHTLDVPPGATMTADIDADASGQWLFHCHLLYHMMSGMARVFQYSTLIEMSEGKGRPQNISRDTEYYNRPIIRVDKSSPIDYSMVKHPMIHPVGFNRATFIDVGADPSKNIQRFTVNGLYGADYNKLQIFSEDAEIKKGKMEKADVDIFYWHLVDQFSTIKGGVNYFYDSVSQGYWQPGVGVEVLMPYFIDTNVRGYFYAGSAKLDVILSRDTQITNNFFIRLGWRSILASKTVISAAIGSGLNQMRFVVRPYYRIMPGLNIIAEYEHEQSYGSLKNIRQNAGESVVEDTLIFGVAFVL